MVKKTGVGRLSSWEGPPRFEFADRRVEGSRSWTSDPVPWIAKDFGVGESCLRCRIEQDAVHVGQMGSPTREKCRESGKWGRCNPEKSIIGCLTGVDDQGWVLRTRGRGTSLRA